MMTGGEAVAASLVAHGVTHVFGIASVHNLPIYEALTRAPGITVVRMRHEQGATHAADGYARATGRLGVVLASTGPGTTNTVSGLYEAQFASSPVLLITGQVETGFYGRGKGFLHEFDRQVEMLRTVTRRVESVRRTEDIATTLRSLIAEMRAGRPQPGAIEIPIDLQYRTADVPIPDPAASVAASPDAAPIAQAIELLNGASRPLIWAGGGVTTAAASAELVALAERLQAPVITTYEGRGSIPEDHPLAIGARSDRGALAPIIAEADVVLAVGTRFQNYATRMWRLPIPGKLVHLDVDPAVIGRNYPVTVGIVTDARLGLAALLDGIDQAAGNTGYLERVRKAVEADLEQCAQDNGPDHESIAWSIRRLLPANAVVARDATVPAYLWGNRTLPVLAPRTSIRPTGMAIGPGLPLAIGAAFGTGERTVLIQGDGGLMLSIGELATAAEYRLPLIILVFNDGGYGVLRQIEDAMMERRFGVDLHTPDFVTVARGMGLESERVVGLAEFEPAFERALARPGPTLLDIDMHALSPLTFPLPAHYRKQRRG